MLVQQSPQNDEMKMDDGTNVVMFVVDVRWKMNRMDLTLRYICKNYAGHDSYLRINDRPVLFFYLTSWY
jgi:hypothetical protein